MLYCFNSMMCVSSVSSSYPIRTVQASYMHCIHASSSHASHAASVDTQAACIASIPYHSIKPSHHAIHIKHSITQLHHTSRPHADAIHRDITSRRYLTLALDALHHHLDALHPPPHAFWRLGSQHHHLTLAAWTSRWWLGSQRPQHPLRHRLGSCLRHVLRSERFL